jgi:DNA-binding LacI/PurR family transcriptional regulator
LSVPGDVSVVGFDGDSIGEMLDPPLATVAQPSIEMGRVAMQILLEQLATSNHQPQQRVLKTHWVPRASICPPKDPKS